MKTVLIVDDDFALQPLIEAIANCGYTTTWFKSANQALADSEKIKSFDLIVLDVILECPDTLPAEETHGGHRAGVVLARRLRELAPDIPIIAFSASQDGEVAKWFRTQKGMQFFNKSFTEREEILTVIEDTLGGNPSEKSGPKIFIVHGHDEATKKSVKQYLQEDIGLPEPIILHEQKSGGRTIIEKFEKYSNGIDKAVVLLTPDDKIAEPGGENIFRARQNVILEMGFFMSALGRGNVILLHKGKLDIPSDISGVIYIDISEGVESAGEIIRRELGLKTN